jgi:hypothetical protein
LLLVSCFKASLVQYLLVANWARFVSSRLALAFFVRIEAHPLRIHVRMLGCDESVDLAVAGEAGGLINHT